MATPKLRNEEYSTLYLDYMSPEKACKEIMGMAESAIASGYSNLKLDLRQDDYSDSYSLVMRGDRMETMSEATHREEHEKMQEERKKAWDLAEFKRLQEKYGTPGNA